MATKLTVKRTDLIKAIKAKAKENQKAHDAQVAAQSADSDFVRVFNENMDKAFGKTANDQTYPKNGTGYTRGNIRSYFSYVCGAFGIPVNATLPSPKLFEKELAILEMATDETLSIDDSSDYFSFLKS